MNSLRRKKTSMGCPSFDLQSLEDRRMLSASVRVTTSQTLETQIAFETPSGVIVNMDIGAARQVAITNGHSVVTASITVALEEYDTVNFVDVMLAQGAVSAPSAIGFNLDPSLKSGTLKATVPMDDQFSGTQFYLYVNLKFKAGGPVTSTRSLTRDPSTGAVDLSISQLRNMIASGSITRATADSIGLTSYFDPSQFEEANASQGLDITVNPATPTASVLFSKVPISDPTAALLASAMGVFN